VGTCALNGRHAFLVQVASVWFASAYTISAGGNMAIPLGAVLSATPGIISAAAEIIRAIRERKLAPQEEAEKLGELESLVEKQALIIEELAINNQNLVLAVRNNRVLSGISVALGLLACGLAIYK